MSDFGIREDEQMTREQAREAAQIMLAWADGKEVQAQTIIGHWVDVSDPNWNFDDIVWRMKPTAKLRPWTADEVPLGAWIRFKRNPQTRFLLCWVPVGADRELWLDEREHSTDGGKTWLPCGVMEEAK